MDLVRSDRIEIWCFEANRCRNKAKLEVNHSEIDSKRFAHFHSTRATVEFNVSKWNSRVSSRRSLSLCARSPARLPFLFVELSKRRRKFMLRDTWITFNLYLAILHARSFRLFSRIFFSRARRWWTDSIKTPFGFEMVWCAIPLPWFWSSLLYSLSC